jgi:predicted protein tyrosine phosphatase
MKHFLFVCSANKQRSKTGEDYFSALYPHLTFSSAGTHLKVCEKEGTTPLSEEMLMEADLVFVMEQKHFQQINRHTAGKYGRKIVVLGIDDLYKYYQSGLIELLVEKTARYFEKL